MTEPYPLVSIIMPSYNYAGYIKESIGSVIKQTYKNWELIIVDNYSLDNTEEVIHSFPDKRIHYHKFANQGIVAASRNLAIKNSTGGLIAFLDADDVWYPNKLEETVTFFKRHQECDLACHDLDWVYREKEDLKRKVRRKPWSSFRDLLFKGNSLFTSAIVVKRKKILDAGFFSEDKQFAGAEDYEMWLRLSQICRINSIHQALGYYIVHQGSFSADIERQAKNLLNVVFFHYDHLFPKKIGDRWRMNLREADIFRQVGRDFLKRKDILKARQWIIKALRLNPFLPKAWFALFKSFLIKRGSL